MSKLTTTIHEKQIKKKGTQKNKLKKVIESGMKMKPSLVNKVKETKLKKKSKKYSLPSKVVTDRLVTSCLNALVKLAESYKIKNKMFEDESMVFAQITFVKIPNRGGKITLKYPHSTVPSTGEVCLITRDMKKGKKVDHEPTIDYWEEQFKKANVTKVKTILPMRQLRVEYGQYELKRRLLTQHDYVMVDTRVLNHVTRFLGKIFLKKHNMLIPVRIDESKDLKKCIDVGLHTAVLRLSEGATSTVVVGHMGMSQIKLKENIMSLIKQLSERFPGGEANIRAITIKLPLSMSLPLFVTLKPSSSVKQPKLEQQKPKLYKPVEGELSIMPNCVVTVMPDGTIKVKKSDKKDELIDSDMEEDIKDDQEETDVEHSE